MKKVLAFSALPLLFLFVAGFQSSNSVAAQLAAINAKLDSMETQLSALAAKGPRQFYLTKTTHNGANALLACAPGYHMASLWEIHDPTNLRYDTELGATTNDSGLGPPTILRGWVRTGATDFGGVGIGQSNCNAWTSSELAHWGSIVGINNLWEEPQSAAINPWAAAVSPCPDARPVWCVQD